MKDDKRTASEAVTPIHRAPYTPPTVERLGDWTHLTHITLGSGTLPRLP